MLPIKLEEFFPEEKLQEMNEKEIKILEAAIEIFAEKGFVSTSTNEIAKKANVAEGTIFRYFKTKKDLLKSIIKPTLVKTIAPFEMDRFSKAVFHLEHETFEDFLDALIKNRMDFAKKNKAVVKIIIQEMPFQEDMQEELKRLFKDKMYPKVATVLQSFIDKGQIKEFPIPTVLRLIISTVIGLVISSIALENTPLWNEEQETRRTIEYIKDGLK